jgi:hypothetical protein
MVKNILNQKHKTMQSFSKARINALLLLSFFALISIFVFAGKYGVDTYEIYLNDQLMMRNALDKPLSLKNLRLTDANMNDQLIVRYRECHAPKSGVKDRVISLRDESGKVVKEWNFNDGENSSAMTIPVKEILQAQKSSGESLTFVYSSGTLGRAQKLALM